MFPYEVMLEFNHLKQCIHLLLWYFCICSFIFEACLYLVTGFIKLFDCRLKKWLTEKDINYFPNSSTAIEVVLKWLNLRIFMVIYVLTTQLGDSMRIILSNNNFERCFVQ